MDRQTIAADAFVRLMHRMEDSVSSVYQSRDCHGFTGSLQCYFLENGRLWWLRAHNDDFLRHRINIRWADKRITITRRQGHSDDAVFDIRGSDELFVEAKLLDLL